METLTKLSNQCYGNNAVPEQNDSLAEMPVTGLEHLRAEQVRAGSVRGNRSEGICDLLRYGTPSYIASLYTRNDRLEHENAKKYATNDSAKLNISRR